MNFIEAVQALKDGLCGGISRRSRPPIDIEGLAYEMLSAESILATDWELVGEKVKYENIEVVKYMVKGKNGDFFYDNKPNEPCVRLSGVVAVMTKPKIKRREEVCCKQYTTTKDVPHKAKFFAEWEE